MTNSNRFVQVAIWLCLAATAHSQTLYRSVGQDGRVTFSDVPPAKAQADSVGKSGAPAGGGGQVLPYELQQVVNRYPVTLYSGDDCSPCASGRNYLNSRGVPYTERTVKTADDVAAMQRLAGAASLPLLTVGSQQIKGYSDVEWGQFLDAAGYSARNRVPASYRRPAPTPLVQVLSPTLPVAPPLNTVGPVTGPTVETFNTRPRPSTAPAPAANGNPSGIRF